MNLSPMRFKQFVWPHNPRIYSTTFEREMAVNKIPMGRHYLQSLGRTCRIFRGEGEFTGQGAYDTFKQLEAVFQEESAGTLVHPVWMAVTAWFVSLKLEQEPRSDYVRYSFEFREVAHGVRSELRAAQEMHTAAAGSVSKVFHTAVEGETLWIIARRYDLTEEQILALNPGLRNPNLISAGQKVRVA